MTARSIDVAALREDQIDAAGQLVARAFQHEPMFTYAFPDPIERTRVLPAFFAWNVRHGHMFGRVHGIGAPLRGVAIVFPPDDDIWTDDRTGQSGFDYLGDIVGVQAMERVEIVQNLVVYAESHLHQVAPESHWYLDVIAVDPPQQGNGLGGILIEAIHAELGASGLPITLLTHDQRTVRFYLRHGYQLVCEGTEPTSGIHHWGMRRST